MAIPAQTKTNCGATCCVGSSADLVGGDCDAWGKFTRNPQFTKAAEDYCGEAVHTDPAAVGVLLLVQTPTAVFSVRTGVSPVHSFPSSCPK
jgi:hypothetical protein